MPIPFLVHSHNQFYTHLVEKFLLQISKKNINLIKPHLKGKTILDVGVGAGLTFRLLKEIGFQITGLDISDLSIYPDIKATLYDGTHFPFKDQQFDNSLLIHVLHHCEDQQAVLREAARTSDQVIIVEDTYKNIFEQIITNVNDCLGNFEFYRHPYHPVSEWQKIFNQNQIKLIKKVEFYRRPWYFPFSVHYVLFIVTKK